MNYLQIPLDTRMFQSESLIVEGLSYTRFSEPTWCTPLVVPSPDEPSQVLALGIAHNRGWIEL
jgi:hypothetical protein